MRREAGEDLRLEDLLKKEHDGWLFDELVRTPDGWKIQERVTDLNFVRGALEQD